MYVTCKSVQIKSNERSVTYNGKNLNLCMGKACNFDEIVSGKVFTLLSTITVINNTESHICVGFREK